MSNSLLQSKLQRRRRVRAKISGTAERPRLSVRITNRHVLAQLIDDVTGHTLAAVSSANEKSLKGTLTERATWAGEQIAELAGKKKIKRIVFDRNGRIYHGRLHALAEAARGKGLEF